MAYTPTNWQTGDTITAEKLNNIENGINNVSNISCAYIISPEDPSIGDLMLTKTYNEIKNATLAGIAIPIITDFNVDPGAYEFYNIVQIFESEGEYRVYVASNSGGSFEFWSSDPDDPLIWTS